MKSRSLLLVFFLIGTLISLSGFAQSGVIRGIVSTQIGDEPIPFATVSIQGTTTGVVTDIDGKYRFNDLTPGLYNLEVSSVGYKSRVIFEIEVTNAREAEVNVQLEEMTVEVEEAEVVASSISNREEAPLSVRKIGINEVKRNPGGNRDISRALQSLPGVASVPSFRNDIIIRGGSPNENRFYIDGIEIPNINHFATQGASGGPVGLINVDFIKDVEFYSGAFPANRGNALSSVIDFSFKDGRTDEYSANAVIGSSDLGITFEGPTGKNSSIIASVRRSYLQFLFEALRLPFLPTYNDFQFKWKKQLNENTRLTVLGLGAIDDFELNTSLAEDPEAEDYFENKYLLDLLAVNTQWNYSIGAKIEQFRENSTITLVGSRNMLNNEAFKHRDNNPNAPKTLDYQSQEMENKFRLEHKLYLNDSWKLNYGAGYEYARYNNNSKFERYSFVEQQLVDVDYSAELDLHKYAVFGQISKTLAGERLILSAGIRLDGNEYSEEMANPLNQFSPRLSARYQLTPELSFNFNTGIYYQLPPYTVLGFTRDGQLVNRENNVSYIRNKQVVAGWQYDLNSRNSIITVEGFYKDYDNYPASVSNGISLANLGADFGVVGNEEVTSSSDGRAYGVEFLYQQKFYKGFYGIVAYTFVRSEFTDAEGNFKPSAWDSRHLVSLTGGKKLPRNWEIGARFRLSGGLPYTPYNVEASMLIPNWTVNNSGLPDYSQLNSRRIDAFHQLDVRIDKKWFFDKWSLNLFLDIQNIYNQVTPLQPILDTQRDMNGDPVVNPNDPNSYLPIFRDNSNGSILPSIGVIAEI